MESRRIWLLRHPFARFRARRDRRYGSAVLVFSRPGLESRRRTRRRADFLGWRGMAVVDGRAAAWGVAERAARCIPDRRDPSRVVHAIADMIRAQVFGICRGYEDADDLDVLRSDPAFKLACGRLPDSGRDLCSQPTLSRLENAPRLKDVIRLTYALVDQWMASYESPPSRVTLDIDDTCDVAHGHQCNSAPGSDPVMTNRLKALRRRSAFGPGAD